MRRKASRDCVGNGVSGFRHGFHAVDLALCKLPSFPLSCQGEGGEGPGEVGLLPGDELADLDAVGRLASAAADLLNVGLDTARSGVRPAAAVRRLLRAARRQRCLAGRHFGIGLLASGGPCRDLGGMRAGKGEDVGGHAWASLFDRWRKIGPGSGTRKSRRSDGAGGPLDRAGRRRSKLLHCSNSPRRTRKNPA